MTDDLRVHRLGFGRVLAWVFLVLVALAAVNGLVTGGTARQKVAVLLVCAALAGLTWLAGLRPAVVEQPTQLLVRNPLRTARLPWAAVTDVIVRDVVVVETVRLVVRCFALPRRDRPPMFGGGGRGELGRPLPAATSATDVKPPKVTSEVVDRLNELAHSLGQGASVGEPTYRVEAPEAVVLGAAILLGVAGVVVGLLG